MCLFIWTDFFFFVDANHLNKTRTLLCLLTSNFFFGNGLPRHSFGGPGTLQLSAMLIISDLLKIETALTDLETALLEIETSMTGIETTLLETETALPEIETAHR